MQNYDRLIMDRLRGDTPRKKYEYLVSIQQLLRSIAYPRRGTDEESWDIEDVATKIGELVDQDDDFGEVSS